MQTLAFRFGYNLKNNRCALVLRSHDLGGTDYSYIATLDVAQAQAIEKGDAGIHFLGNSVAQPDIQPAYLKVKLRENLDRDNPPWLLMLECNGEQTEIAQLTTGKVGLIKEGVRGSRSDILPSQAEVDRLNAAMKRFKIEDLRAEADRLEAELDFATDIPTP